MNVNVTTVIRVTVINVKILMNVLTQMPTIVTNGLTVPILNLVSLVLANQEREDFDRLSDWSLRIVQSNINI